MIGFMGDFYHIRTFSYEQIIYMYFKKMCHWAWTVKINEYYRGYFFMCVDTVTQSYGTFEKVFYRCFVIMDVCVKEGGVDVNCQWSVLSCVLLSHAWLSTYQGLKQFDRYVVCDAF